MWKQIHSVSTAEWFTMYNSHIVISGDIKGAIQLWHCVGMSRLQATGSSDRRRSYSMYCITTVCSTVQYMKLCHQNVNNRSTDDSESQRTGSTVWSGTNSASRVPQQTHLTPAGLFLSCHAPLCTDTASSMTGAHIFAVIYTSMPQVIYSLFPPLWTVKRWKSVDSPDQHVQ